MHCARVVLHLCLVEQAPLPSGFVPSLFGFPQFMSALALLAVVYTVTDIRYRFRLAVAPVSLYPVTYVLLVAIGTATLTTDIWIRERWLVPQIGFLTASLWEAAWGAVFLFLALTWIYFAFMRPARFGTLSSFRYASTLYRAILKGSDTELPIIADELGRSAKRMVARSSLDPPRLPIGFPQNTKQRIRLLAWLRDRIPRRRPTTGACAHDILLMIGNRKFCRHLVASAPGTVIAIFNAAGERKALGLPLGQFARNVSGEAIDNEDSSLYHEDEGFESGYFGYVKPFSEALFGNYELVEALADRIGSPLDVRYRAATTWTARQAEVYERSVLITFKDYLRKRRNLYVHSYALYRALGHLKDTCGDMYTFEPGAPDSTKSELTEKFRVVVKFGADAANAIDKEKGLDLGQLRVRETRNKPLRDSFCDHLAEFMFDMLFLAASVKGDDFSVWHIQHNTAWDAAFGFPVRGGAHAVVAFKLRRLLYDEICRLKDMPNYKSARILGLCLYVTGLRPGNVGIDKSYRALKVAVHRWTKKNYARLVRVQPDVANACLVGTLSYDAAGRRLAKTYEKHLNSEPPKEYLELDADQGA